MATMKTMAAMMKARRRVSLSLSAAVLRVPRSSNVRPAAAEAREVWIGHSRINQCPSFCTAFGAARDVVPARCAAAAAHLRSLVVVPETPAAHCRNKPHDSINQSLWIAISRRQPAC